MKTFGLTISAGLFLATLVSAQELPRFTADIGGGFTNTVGRTGRNLNDGWNIQGGAGVNFSRFFGAKIDLAYNSFGINSNILSSVGAPGGDVHIFSATLDPIIHVNAISHVDAYLIGGAGLYRQLQEFTAPSAATVTAFDPFFGFYGLTVPTTQVLASYSVNKLGVNGGAGLAFGTRRHVKIFVEARYHRILMNNRPDTQYIPVTFGLRW